MAVFDTKRAELVADEVRAQHSPMMKVALSELVVQTAADLHSPEIRPKDRALALAALKSVSNQLYGWDKEVDIQNMERAGTSVQGQLFRYTPEELRQMANAQLAKERSEPSELPANSARDGQDGAPATERNGQGASPSVMTPEQTSAATHGRPSSEKEAPKPPEESQSAQVAPIGRPPVPEKPQQAPDWFERIAHPAPLTHSSLSPQERRKQQLEELARLRAEWRRGH